MSWLLDTNTWIDYLKNPASAVRTRLMERKPEEISTCSIVRAELLHGARKYGAPERRLAIVRETLAPYRSLPFDDAAAEHYAGLRHGLLRGVLSGVNPGGGQCRTMVDREEGRNQGFSPGDGD